MPTSSASRRPAAGPRDPAVLPAAGGGGRGDTRSFQVHSRPMRDDRSDETDPFARLERTHQRIEERLVTVEKAVIDVTDSAKRQDAVADIEEVVDFFGRAARRHHDDEE